MQTETLSRAMSLATMSLDKKPRPKRSMKEFDLSNYHLPIGSRWGTWTVTGAPIAKHVGERRHPYVPVVCDCGTVGTRSYYRLTRIENPTCNKCSKASNAITVVAEEHQARVSA